MEKNTILIFVITGLLAILFIWFLIRKNNRDRQSMNPDSQDLIDEIKNDQERDRDRT